MGKITDLANIVSDVSAYFQHKNPSASTLDQWIPKLDNMNLYAARSAIVGTITNGEIFPRNFPAAVKAAYSIWLKGQPRYCEQSGCSKCINGLLHAKKDGYAFAFRCGHCNSNQAAYHTATRYQLEEQGYVLDWQHDYDKPVDSRFMGKIKGLLKSPVIRQESYPEEVPF
jgi:hypothetical protein